MYTEMALIARRFALTLTVAGIAAAGSIAIAPAASADDDVRSTVAVEDDDREDDDRDDDDRDDDDRDDDDDREDGPSTVVHTSKRGGPDAFIVFQHGRKPVFFCDVRKPKQHHNICINMGGPTRF